MVNGAKNWCWTLNNYTELHLQALHNLGGKLDTITYMVWGAELGELGTPHLQGYVQFCSKKTLNQAKSLLPGNPHLEMQSKKSTATEAAAYCKKDGKYHEFGKILLKGQRNDLNHIKKQIDEGRTYEELWEDNFSTMIQYRKGFKEYIDIKRSKIARNPPSVYIFWGCTGTGKTRRAWAIDKDSSWVYPGKGWFDGYHGQRVAIFDEFDGDDIKFSLWKQLVDRYPMQVPIKGGFTSWTPDIIVFTSNLSPDLWWRNEQLPMGRTEQFTRRVTASVRMDIEWDPETNPIPLEDMQE